MDFYLFTYNVVAFTLRLCKESIISVENERRKNYEGI